MLISFPFSPPAHAQTAEGGCTSVKLVSGTPLYPNNAYIDPFLQPCSYCNECNKKLNYQYLQSPRTAQFSLQQPEGESWVTVAGWQLSSFFDDLPHGWYRIAVRVPQYIAAPNCTSGWIKIYNTFDQHVGYEGEWAPYLYSNPVLVGATTAEDISYTFVDIPETGAEQAYDLGETVIMNVSECRNYDLWWLAIFEDGPTYNRYRSNGWTSGSTVPNDEFNLTAFWDGGAEWKFETFHSYTVQFAIENRNCRNGIEQIPPTTWNNLDRTFFICPAGSGCRFRVDKREIIISPNPANSTIRLQNFEPDLDSGYVLTISDLAGKTVKNISLTTDWVDISDLQSGMFVVHILREGQLVFISKLVVNQ